MSTTTDREPPRYAQIVATIRARIVAGELEPGARVPSTREITRAWSVAMATASKVLSTLRQEGLVEVVRGVGTVVKGTDDRAQPRGAVDHAGRLGPPAGTDRRRPSEATLTREGIVRAAISVVDAEGVEDFSMRRVSTELGVSTMALYRHVADKADLLSAMIDAIYQEAELPEFPRADWRRALELAMLWDWGVLRRHPWAVRLTPAAGQSITPAVMVATEQMMSVITAEGHSPDAALEIVTVVQAYTTGMASAGLLVEVDELELVPDRKQWWKQRGPEIVRSENRGRFPTVFSVTRPPDVDRIFNFGMERLLDGLALMISSD